MLKLFKKNVSHSLLAALLVVFVVADIQIPIEIANLLDTLLGRVFVAGVAISLLLKNSVLGVLGIIAAYELLRRAEKNAAGGAAGIQIPNPPAWSHAEHNTNDKYLPSEQKKAADLSSLNQFPLTLEETLISEMIPFTSNSSMGAPSYRPTLDSLYDAARVD
jgi:hypothetical protein